MPQAAEFMARHWQQLALPIGVLLATMLAALVARRVLFRALDRWASRTSTGLDNIIVAALRAPFLLWALILAMHLAMQVSLLPDRATQVAAKPSLILWVVSLTLVASKFAASIPAFGDSSLQFTLICQVAEFVDQYGVQRELRKRIFRRFRRERIEIPFPMRTLQLRRPLKVVLAAAGAPSERTGESQTRSTA